jgi:cytochrome P450
MTPPSRESATREPDINTSFTKDVAADPAVLHARLRETCPVALQKSDGGPLQNGWLVTRYEDIAAVTRDPETFQQPVRWPGQPRPPLESNPPEHRHFRAVLQPFFMPGALAQFEPLSRRLATSLLDVLIDAGGGDFAMGLARPLPPQVLLARLGQPLADWERIKECCEASFLQGSTDQADVRAYEEANAYLWEYSHSAVAARRAGQGNPRGPAYAPEPGCASEPGHASEPGVSHDPRGPHDPVDTFSDPIRAMLAATLDGAPIDVNLVAGMVRLLLAAGHDSTTSAMGICLRYLAENTAAQTHLRANPSGIPAAVEEILRLQAPVIQMPRIVTKDVELGGRALEAGDRVLLVFASGNRDGRKFEAPEECRLDRAPNRHLSFGSGIHVCIGNGLARQEIRVTLEELLRRTEMFGQAAEPRREFWHPYGVTRLMLWVKPAMAAGRKGGPGAVS